MDRRWRSVAEICECGATPNLFNLAATLELFRHGKNVNWLALFVEPLNSGVDLRVRRLVEVARLEAVRNLQHHLAVNEKRAENALFSVARLRGELVAHARIIAVSAPRLQTDVNELM